jgi:ABC-2 type transport system ATP-binding protein
MVKINNLSFGYSRKKILYDKLNLSLETGRIYGLLGKNGAGKSTLLRNMCGLLFPSAGTISVNGFEPQKRQPSFLQTVYLIPEQIYVPRLSINRYVELYAPFYPKFDIVQFRDFMDVLKVEGNPKLTDLSFGQQKKFIIAFGLACNTQLLIMDEPTNGLDIPSKSQFRKLLASTITDDRIFIISTHQVRDLDNLIDQVVVVDNGEVLLNASIDEISEKLCFKLVPELPDTEQVLYSESSMMGHAVVMANTEGVDTKVHLEYLFNAITAHPDKTKAIFNNLKHH